jgi:hypothetical protein
MWGEKGKRQKPKLSLAPGGAGQAPGNGSLSIILSPKDFIIEQLSCDVIGLINV